MNLSKIAGFALGPVLSALLGLLTVPLMAWTFEPEVIGKVAMLTTFLAGCSLVFTLGLDQAYVREYHEVEDKPALFYTLVVPSLIITFVFCLVILLFHEAVSQVLFSEVTNTWYIAGLVAAAVFLTIILRFFSLVLRMKEQGLKFSLMQVSTKFSLLFAILVLLIIGGSYGFITALSFSCLSIFVSIIFALYFTNDEWRVAFSKKIDKETLVKALKFGSPLIISGFAFWGLTSVDKLAIRYFSGMEQLGVYSVAFSFAAVMTIFQRVFSTIWAPIVYRWNKDGVKIDQFSLVTDWVVIVLSSVFFMVVIASPILTFILPQTYSGVINLLPACMLFPVFYTLSETTVVGMNVARKTGYSILITLLPLFLNIILSYVLIPAYGAGGAALSVALSFFIYLLLRTEVSKKLWVKFRVFELYLVSLILIINAVIPALTSQNTPWYISLLSFIFISFLYRKRYLNIKNDLKMIRN